MWKSRPSIPMWTATISIVSPTVGQLAYHELFESFGNAEDVVADPRVFFSRAGV